MKRLKVKLSRMEVCSLFDMFMITLTFKDPIGFKDALVKEVMFELLDQMDKMIHNEEQKRFTLKLTGAQSMAFLAYTSELPLDRSPYEQVTINRIAEAIHKHRHNAAQRSYR